MMKFGLLTAILDGWSFEEVVDIASQMGFKCRGRPASRPAPLNGWTR